MFVNIFLMFIVNFRYKNTQSRRLVNSGYLPILVLLIYFRAAVSVFIYALSRQKSIARLENLFHPLTPSIVHLPAPR